MEPRAELSAGRAELAGIFRAGEARRASAVVFQVEPLAAVRHDILPLIESHYEEIAQFKGAQKLDPDWDTYTALERAGRLWVMTVRDGGALVGYIVMIIGKALHYKQLVTATEDIHYLLPAYRKGLTGYRLLAKARSAMAARGAGLTSMRCKAGPLSHAALFERMGGELSDLVYVFASGGSDGP